MRKFFNKLFNYVEISNFERGGLLALLFSLVLVAGYYYYDNATPSEQGVVDLDKLASFRSQVDSAFAKRVYKKTDYRDYNRSENYSDKPLKTFNPATDSKQEMIDNGVPHYVAEGIVNFRNAGGDFKSKKDVAKIYAVNDNMFQKLRPFIDLPETSESDVKDWGEKKWTNKDTAALQVPLDINKLSVEELKALPGIGDFYAKQIVKYRDKLGGYKHKGQLREVYKMREETVDQIEDMFVYDVGVSKINVNTATFKQLLSHPYLDFNQVKALVNYREQHGPFTDISTIENLHIFKGKDISRLLPYLDLN